MKNAHTFKLTDESINSYGFITLTDSLDVSVFENNPVMLYEHNSLSVIGKWTNIRKEDGKLLADAVYDIDDDMAKKVMGKVERDFIKGVSVGMQIDPKSIKYNKDNVPMVTNAKLLEASICAIPSNSNAIRLYNNERQELNNDDTKIFLNNIIDKKMENKMGTEVLAKLSVGTEEKALERIEDLLSAEQELQELKREQEQAKDELIEQELSKAIKENKIVLADKEVFKKLAKSNYDLFAKTLEKLTSTPKMSDVADNTPPKIETLSFDEWRKKDPAGLLKYKKENPEGYNELIKKA